MVYSQQGSYAHPEFDELKRNYDDLKRKYDEVEIKYHKLKNHDIDQHKEIARLKSLERQLSGELNSLSKAGTLKEAIHG